MINRLSSVDSHLSNSFDKKRFKGKWTPIKSPWSQIKTTQNWAHTSLSPKNKEADWIKQENNHLVNHLMNVKSDYRWEEWLPHLRWLKKLKRIQKFEQINTDTTLIWDKPHSRSASTHNRSTKRRVNHHHKSWSTVKPNSTIQHSSSKKIANP